MEFVFLRLSVGSFENFQDLVEGVSQFAVAASQFEGCVGDLCRDRLAGLLHANMFAEGWLLPVSVVFLASFGAELAYGLLMAVLDVGLPFWSALVRIMLPGAVYNTVLAVLLYPLMTRVLRRDRTVKSFRRLA